VSHVFRHPKYYKELRAKAASNKPQASSAKQSQVPDASVKPQAQGVKRQATSVKLPDA